MATDHIFELPNTTVGGDQIIVGIAGVIPNFTPLLLLFVWFFVFLGGVLKQKDRLGGADYPMWSVVASLSTLIISLILTTITGLIQLDWLVIVVVVTIFTGVWAFLQKRDGVV